MNLDSPLPDLPTTDIEPAFRSRSRLWPRLLLIGGGLCACLALCLGAALVSLLQTPRPLPVTIALDGSAYQVDTQAQTVGLLLDEMQINLDEGDVVDPPLETTLSPDLIVYVEHARLVTLTVDGESQVVRTLFTNPLDILTSAGITVHEPDQVLVDGTPADMRAMLVWPVPVSQITIRRAVELKIIDGDKTASIQTTSATVGEALFEAGVTLYLADSVTPGLNTPVSADLTVTVQRSRPISIVADGVTLETRTMGTTVADALADVGVALMGLDYAIPAEDSPLRPGMTVRVIRVTEEVMIEQEIIPFETVYQADAQLELDQHTVAQEGQNGIRQRTLRIRYENGIEVGRQPESDQVASEPINRVLAYGTNITLRTIDTPEGPRQYWRQLRMYATSYYPAAMGGDVTTATGHRLTKGIVGSDPAIIPYGTQVFVPGYGVGQMEDTGILPSRLWIDLGYDDENYVPWSRYVDVYLLAPVPAKIEYFLPD